MSSSSTLLHRSPIASSAIRILSIALSLGVHYLIASNLGLFAIPEPPKLRPVGGTVKVVDLTPAERSRVPDVVKSSAFPIASTPVNPSVAIPGQGSSFGFNNSPAPSVPLPSPAPAPNRSVSTPTPDAQPSVNRPPNVTVSPSPRLGLDRDRNLSAFPTGSPGGLGGSQSPSITNRPPSPPSSAPTDRRSPSPSKSVETREQPKSVKTPEQQFEDALKIKAGPQAVDIERNLIPKNTSYAAVSAYKCSNSQDRYVFVGVILGDSSNDGYGEDKDEGDVYNMIVSPVGDELSAAAIDLATTEAKNAHKTRTDAQKKQEKGKKILYKFKFKYDRQTCKS